MTSIREEQKDKGVIIFVKMIFVLAIIASFFGCAHKPAQIYILGNFSREVVVLGSGSTETKFTESRVDLTPDYRTLAIVNETQLFCDIFIGSAGLAKVNYFLGPRVSISLESQPRQVIGGVTSFGSGTIPVFCYRQPDKSDFVGEVYLSFEIDAIAGSFYDGRQFGYVMHIHGVNKTTQVPIYPSWFLVVNNGLRLKGPEPEIP